MTNSRPQADAGDTVLRPHGQATASKARAGMARWHEHAFRAMNTTVSLQHYTPNPGLGRFVETVFRRNEARFSRFRPDSELCGLNRSPSTDNHVSPEMFAILDAARWAHRATGGIFDPAILAELEQAGYDRSFELIDNHSSIDNAPEGHEIDFRMHDVALDHAHRRVHRPVGLRLDLGGIGKGWTVDRCADLLHDEGPFLLNAGGDIYVHGTPGPVAGWEIEIEDALNPDASVAALVVTDTAVATSTIVRRRWQSGDRRRHHLIDPRTGAPAATDLLAVTVLAPRVAVAEVYAKSALILGSRAGLDFLAARGVDGLLQTHDGELYATTGMADRLTMLGGVAQEEEQHRA